MVRKRQHALQTSLVERELPRARGNGAAQLGRCAGNLTGQCSHIHGIPAGDAFAVERELMRCHRVDLVNDVLFVACWMRADTVGVPDPSPEEARGLLRRELAEQETRGDADRGMCEGDDHETEPVYGVQSNE